MKTSYLKSKITLVVSIMLIAAMAITFSACGTAEETAVSSVTETVSQTVKELGKGATQFTFIVNDGENETEFLINTDKKTVGEALLDLKLIAGDQSEYGLYVKTVNGVTVDYDKDKAYWAFYIDGEYAQTGVDATQIEAGKTYTFKVEKG